MLIEDNILNTKEFKKFFKELDWVRVPRTLTQDHTDYFYVGVYEDSDISIKAIIRPSMYMQLFETFKNRTIDGKKPGQISNKTKLVDWGASVEVLVDESFMKKVKSVAKEKEPEKRQTLSWS